MRGDVREGAVVLRRRLVPEDQILRHPEIPSLFPRAGYCVSVFIA
jgi:hypothetical protein